MKPVLCFLIVTVLCGGCAKQQPPRGLTIREGVLSVGVEAGYPPMEYYDRDGKTLLGIDIELADALAAVLGLKADYIDVAWEGILAGLDTGRYDMAINITIIPDRQTNYNFTKPYLDSSIAITARKDAGYVIEEPEALAGYRVCYQGDTTAQYFTERLSGRGIVFTPYSYDTILNCFDDLALRRVDFVVADTIAAFGYTGDAESPFEVVWQGPSDESIGICLKKGNDALTDALNDALDTLAEQGTLARITQKAGN